MIVLFLVVAFLCIYAVMLLCVSERRAVVKRGLQEEQSLVYVPHADEPRGGAGTGGTEI